MSDSRTEISQVGEFGLIDRINKNFSLSNSSSLTGIGDDAAVLEAGEEAMLICL
jgi:thiamine-monophosphate kinase